MRVWTRPLVIVVTAVVLLAGCAPPPQSASGSQKQAPSGSLSGGTKRMTAAIRDNPTSFAARRERPSAFRGLDGMEELANAGLTHLLADGTRAPQLAEAVPTLENGLWKVFPDGRMETTWKIKSNARWHDGTPLTVDDLIFTATVERDKAVIVTPAAYDLVENISAQDANTITVTWSSPFIEADWMFGVVATASVGLPLPKHLLEGSYNDDKSTFLSLPFWTSDYVGTGPFKVQEWVQDSYALFRAYDNYVLGKPKIDEIEVKFIPDNNTLLANVLAGVDLTLGKTISLDMALGAEEQWRDGKVLLFSQNWTPLNQQWINPDPPIISNYQFRKALYLALDRKQLADFVITGHGIVADSYVNPNEPGYNLIEPSIVKYPYDPQQSAQILQTLGFTKRGDGLLYDAEGKKLEVAIQIPLQNDVHTKTAAPVADTWRRLGVTVDEDPLPIQRAQDREFRSQFPGFNITERSNALDIADIWNFHSSRIPLPENRYVTTGFAERYRSAEVDAALEKYSTAIPMTERMGALAQLVHHQTENLSEMPLFYGLDPTMVSNRLVNVGARGALYTQAWNAEQWDVK